MTVQIRLQDLKAVPNPRGNRVDVQWLNPLPHQFTRIRIRRMETTHPVRENDGEQVAEEVYSELFTLGAGFVNDLDDKNLTGPIRRSFIDRRVTLSAAAGISVVDAGNRWLITGGDRRYLIVRKNGALGVYPYWPRTFTDDGLRAETVYYYSFFPYNNDPAVPVDKRYVRDPRNRTSSMSTGPYDFGGRMYRMLPAIYHRYDTALPRGEHVDRVTETDRQRGQLRRFLDIPGFQLDQLYSFAAAGLNFRDIHRVDGNLLPLLAQWIGWDTDYTLEIAARRNELRNAPSMYRTMGIIPNIEAAVVKCIGGWETGTKEFVHNVFRSNRPEQLNLWLCRPDEEDRWFDPDDVFSLDAAYEGRPATVRDNNNTLWLFYHTHGKDGKDHEHRWNIRVKTYKKNHEEKWEWTPGLPFTDSHTMDKSPAAALRDDTLWVFWSAYDPELQTRELKYRKRINGTWVEMENFEEAHKLPGAPGPRKNPCAVTDRQNRLWLFWLEGRGNRRRLRYNRFDGTQWESASGVDFPPDGTGDPGVEKDVFVLFRSTGAGDRLWVSWARKRHVAPDGRRYWEIAYREKSDLDSINAGWGPVRILSKEPGKSEYHDCEPAAVVYTRDEEERFELYWSSNRGGGWALWRARFDGTTGEFNEPGMFIQSPYSQRAPLPLVLEDSMSLLYRSNKSITYKSEVYGATETTDFRYAGCTAVNTRDNLKIGLRRKFGDFLTYTYDTGKNGQPTKDDWYSRDTIGIYLTPTNTEALRLIARNRELVRGILERFLPIQIRAIFFINPPLHNELVYTYDFKAEDNENPCRIFEQFEDRLETDPPPEEYAGAGDDYEDTVPQWVWLRSVEIEEDAGGGVNVKYTGLTSVDFGASPVDTTSRTVHTALKGNIKEEKE